MLRTLVACALLASTTIACSDDHDHEDENETLADVVFVGATTDEALAVMLDKPAKDVPGEYVTFISPDAGATLSKDTPVAVEFQPPSAQHTPRAPEQAPFPVRTPQPNLSAKQRVLAGLNWLVHPIGVAHAHGAPFNGSGYFLVFADASKKTSLRVFTDQTSYTPTATEWAGLAAGQQPITISLTSATFEDNAVPADGGPFIGGTVEFSVH